MDEYMYVQEQNTGITPTITWYSVYPIVICPFVEKCSDNYSNLCQSCKHNNRRSYYEPSNKLIKKYPSWLIPSELVM